MTRNASGNLGRWREGKPGAATTRSPGRERASRLARASLLGVLMALSVAALVALIWMIYYPSTPSPYLVAFWVDENQRRSAVERPDQPETRLSSMVPPAPWIAADREALLGANVFRRLDADPEATRNPPKEAIETRLHALQALKPADSVVVYLAAGATVGDDGKVQILANDSDPYRPRTLLPLSAILGELKACPARSKLLVLDIMGTPADPMDLAATADGVAELVREEVEGPSTPGRPVDRDLLVLGACERGQASQVMGSIRGSAFGHFFRLALTEPGADADGDRAVSVKELAAHLDRSVNRWAWQHRGVRQRPFLAGPGRDFPLVALAAKKSSDPWRWPWQKAAPKAPPADPVVVDATEPKKADQPPTAGVEKSADGENKGQPAGGYPRWLSTAWAVRERWWASGEGRAAPRVFRKLETVLLRAERRWRVGDDPGAVRKDLDAELGPLQAAMTRALTLPEPGRHRSAGQARRLPDKALATALAKAAAAPGPVDPALIEQLKPRDKLDVAAAVVAALRDQPLTAARLQFLDDLIAKSLPPRLEDDVVELRTLRQLAARAKGAPSGDWSDDLARQQWDVTIEAESASFRPDSLPWVRDRLTRADALRQEAEVLSLGRASGLVAPSRVAPAWEEARRSFEAVRDAQDKIETAMDALWRGMARLGGSVPFAEGAGDPEYERSWREAAAAARRLDQLLRRPEAPPSTEDFESLMRGLGEVTEELARHVGVLDRPFRASAIAEVARLCTATEKQADPALVPRIETLLSTPFPTAEDRARLWPALLALEARLTAAERADAVVPPDTVDPSGPLRDRQRSRARRIALLLELTGESDAPRDADKVTSAAVEGLLAEAGRDPGTAREAARNWGLLGQLARDACGRLAALARNPGRDDGREPAAWVAPVFLLDWRADPARRARERDAREGLAWLVGHYDHAGRDNDLFDPALADGPLFYETAARECRTNEPDAPPPSPLAALKIERATPGTPTLSRERPTAEIELIVTAVAPATDGPRQVVLDVLESDGQGLIVRTPSPRELELVPGVPGKVTVRLDWSEDATPVAGRPMPRGFVLAARGPDRRSFHQLVRTEIVAEQDRPRLVVGRDPVKADNLPTDQIRLRPLPGRQLFYLFVRNPSPTPRELLVEIEAGTGPRLQAPLKVKANSTAQFVAPPAPPPPKESDPLPRLDGPLTIRLREGPDGPALDERRLQVALATPGDYLADYLDVVAQFVPSTAPGQKNRLTVSLKALPGLTVEKCAVRLDLPRDATLFPGLREAVKAGTLLGHLEPKGDLQLFAEDLALDPGAPEVGAFAVDVDGLKRALWYTARFVRDGGVQKAQLDRRARVRLRPEYKADPSPATLKVRFEVDNAPSDARLLVRLGTEAGGQVVGGLSWDRPAQDRHLGFDARGADGALRFEARVDDWAHDFPVPGIRGERVLEARLVDATGRTELAYQRLKLMLDDQAPQDAALLVPDPFPQGPTRVKLRASVTPPAAGIRDATFFVGAQASDLAVAKIAGHVAAGRQVAGTLRDWEAILPIPKDKVGQISVAVQFTSPTDMASTATAEIVVLPAPEPVVADAGAAEKVKPPPKPGAISGKVLVGDRTQSGLTVALFVANTEPNATSKMKQIATAKSSAKGTFSFADLPPGSYTLVCSRESDNRRDEKSVPVEPGKTATVQLELLQR